MGAKNRVGIGLSYSAGIFKQFKGARNRVGIGLLYQPVRLHRLAESIPWNKFLGSIRLAESIRGILKSLKIPSLLLETEGTKTKATRCG